MIQASSLRPESTLSLSQAILKTFTRAISFIQRKRGVFFYPCRPALTDYQTHFQRGVFFTRLEPGPIFFRLRRSVVAADGAHAMRATETERVVTIPFTTFTSPSLQFGQKFAFLRLMFFQQLSRFLHNLINWSSQSCP